MLMFVDVTLAFGSEPALNYRSHVWRLSGASAFKTELFFSHLSSVTIVKAHSNIIFT